MCLAEGIFMIDNKMKIEFLSKSENEAFARVAVASFVAQLDPTMDEITDIKTAVSEAVTNSIIHGYENKPENTVAILCCIEGRTVTVVVEDSGVGINNIEEAREPLYTSRPDLERSGMGFTMMETFMDEVEVFSEKNKGTKVVMKKIFKAIS